MLSINHANYFVFCQDVQNAIVRKKIENSKRNYNNKNENDAQCQLCDTLLYRRRKNHCLLNGLLG